MSQATAGHRAGLSQNKVSRLERAAATGTLEQVAILAAVVGLDLVVRLYPGSTPLHDFGHIRLLARLQAQLASHVERPFSWRTEIPIPISGDQRAVDAMLT